MALAGPYASPHLTPDRQPHQHPTTLFFRGRMPFLLPNQQRQSIEGITYRSAASGGPCDSNMLLCLLEHHTKVLIDSQGVPSCHCSIVTLGAGGMVVVL